MIKSFYIAAVLFLLPAAAHAQISIDSACVHYSGTACTLSSTNTGHLKLVIAFSFESSTSAPTVPSGWTAYDSAVHIGSMYYFTYTVGCKVASGSGDTGSGTWTGATTVIQYSYAGTPVGNTANCNTTGLGESAFDYDDTGSSTTASCAGFGLAVVNDTSWVACGLEVPATTVTCPSGLTQEAASTALACDTDGPVSAFPQHDSTFSPNAPWFSYAVEILGTGFTPPAYSQHGGVF